MLSITSGVKSKGLLSTPLQPRTVFYFSSPPVSPPYTVTLQKLTQVSHKSRVLTSSYNSMESNRTPFYRPIDFPNDFNKQTSNDLSNNVGESVRVIAHLLAPKRYGVRARLRIMDAGIYS